MKEEQARASFYGYWEVEPHSNIFLRKVNKNAAFMEFSAKRRHLKAADQIWNQASADTDLVIDQVLTANKDGNVEIEYIAQVLYGAMTLVKSELFQHPNLNKEALSEAASLGIRLGRVDPNRRGENPPVALGIHHDADAIMHTEGAERFKTDTTDVEENPQPFLYEVVFHAGFYLARADRLTLS